MSEIEIKQMQEKINAGILLARKRLIEKTKKEDGECTAPQKLDTFGVFFMKYNYELSLVSR